MQTANAPVMFLALIVLNPSDRNVIAMEASEAAVDALGEMCDENRARGVASELVSVADLSDILMMQRCDAARAQVDSEAAYNELTENMIKIALRYSKV